IFIKKAAGILSVGFDAADARREMDDNIRASVMKHSLDGLLLNQAILTASRDEHVATAPVPQSLDQMRSKKAGTTGDQNSRAVPELHGRYPLVMRLVVKSNPTPVKNL